MPALDYVSIIRSVYRDRRAMLAAAWGTALAAALSAYKSQSLPLFAIALAFIIMGVLRYADSRAFQRADIGSDDAEAAEHWENRAVVSGALTGIVYGAWCFISMVVVRDPFAALTSATLTTAAMVGLVARNFGLDRLVTIQMVLVILPLSVGYAMHGDIYHIVLALLLGIMLASFRKLAADTRSILLSAVHGRVEASRLAAELDMAMTTLEHGLCMLDERGVISVANERAVRLFNLMGQSDLLGQPVSAVLGTLGDSGVLPRTAVDRLLDVIGKHTSGKVLLCLPAGRYYEVSVSSRLERSVLLFEDISERIASEERINFMARHDTLTALPNRTYFGELATEDMEARRFAGARPRLVSLMIIDIDDFKHVNDTFGHIVGDELLMQVANRLRQTVPAEAVLARLGGDEFVIYRGAVGDAAQAQADATAILGAFSEPFRLEGLTLSVTVSVGLTTSAIATEALDDLMTKADLALYSAKGDGKARSQLFHAQMDIDYHYRQRLKADLRDAVRDGALSLSFQPLLDIATRKVVTCEALARWNHPELGPIPPSTFIPLAEEMGLISTITSWVIGHATEQCSHWPGNVGVAVNISARDFRGSDLGNLVEDALARSGLDPARLEIEVTETAVIEEREIAHRVLSDLAAKGIAIALDDFGTGYSSLSYLNALPFTKLKIDRSFVADIASNPRSLRLLANVARLGRDLDLTVIAEGVETEEQLNTMLAHTEIQQVQGYFFSRPLPERDIGELIGRLNAAQATPQANLRHG
ncbi:bifunctional diguanylate cyclase/phosphodiesterase [Devosia ginsengisoli]|uniref:putative bifunctional diguanylate cyclase/phosphodiesterase n=1 Tax=Devosia ginsengisoli TaxID=400770 RepID=UPI0026EC2F6A|nr:EAL domain-containing protein [Devosia ginsengisoli]MCR6671182.1 EAL domain-containing protein [Devosia ginsengisoli]